MTILAKAGDQQKIYPYSGPIYASSYRKKIFFSLLMLQGIIHFFKEPVNSELKLAVLNFL